MKRLIAIIIPLIMAVLILTPACIRNDSAAPAEIDSGMRLVMGTYGRVVVVAENEKIAKTAIADAFEQLKTVDSLMSDYKRSSEITNVNKNAHNKPVPVSTRTFEVLTRSIEFSKLTEGEFDITIGPVKDLWTIAADSNSMPTEDQLAAAREKVGYEKLTLDPNERTVRFAVEGMRLDLGAIAKGYAIDCALDAARNTGALGAMVDVGGDIRCFGQPTRGKSHWLIGLEDPADDPNDPVATEPLLVLQLKDVAIATSGDYRRFFLIDEQRINHIFNRKTAYGAKGLASVTVIAPTAIDADALATSVTALGPEKGLELIENTPNTEAILIPTPTDKNQSAPKFIKTSGAYKYIK